MATHRFGGDWTADKLERVRKYLRAYTTIFSRNVKALYYKTIYIDAFAGTGSIDLKQDHSDETISLYDETERADHDAYRQGSARIALETEPPFDRFLFIEKAGKWVKELESLRSRFPQRQVDIRCGDANDVLKTYCGDKQLWKGHRAVAFLDPYGMQVEWTLIESIAATKAIDLWLLFPLGSAINRVLTSDAPPPEAWARALTRTFGTEDWKRAFYAKTEEPTLFGVEQSERRQARIEDVGRFFIDRLESVFAGVAKNPLPLKNSTNSPIYLLCFAAGNPRGAKTAVKIAQEILGQP